MITITNKRNKIKLLIIIVIILLIYFSGIWAFLKVGFKENEQNRIAIKYESKDSRIQYYNEYKNYFTKLVNSMSNYSEIYEVNVSGNCQDYIYRYEDIIVCSFKKIQNFDTKDIALTFQKINLKRIYREDNKIIFSLISTPEYVVQYSYCLDLNNCNNKDLYYKYSYGIVNENKIDERWSTIYSNIKHI